MEGKYFCPLKGLFGDDKDRLCDGSRCAWWVAKDYETPRCAIKDISIQLRYTNK
jgi:hypothetical protein